MNKGGGKAYPPKAGNLPFSLSTCLSSMLVRPIFSINMRKIDLGIFGYKVNYPCFFVCENS